jgi:hypothetical protein
LSIFLSTEKIAISYSKALYTAYYTKAAATTPLTACTAAAAIAAAAALTAAAAFGNHY